MDSGGYEWGEAAHPGPSNVRERSPDEDILDSLEAALTRVDSSDEEPLVRPTMGRNVLRKVGINSDNVLPLSTQLARRQGSKH